MALQCVIKPNMWLGLKQILLYVGLLLCVLLQVCRSKTQLQLNCPTVCHCDLFAQRNRAICRCVLLLSLPLFIYSLTLSGSLCLCVSLSHSSAKRLISASIDMPKTVELLDLSYNDITNIDADCFEVSRTICHIIKLYTKYRIKMVFFYGSLTKSF